VIATLSKPVGCAGARLMLLLDMSWAHRVWALPFFSVLAPSKRHDRSKNFAREMAQVVSADVEVVRRSQPHFQVLPKRWIVERTFAWWNQYRRLSKDYELLPEVSESMIYTVMIRLMLKRLAQSHTTAS